MTKTKKAARKSLLRFAAAALAICLAALCATAYAAEIGAENLEIDSVSIVGETLALNVTNKLTGDKMILEISLTEYDVTDRYITVRAADTEGNVSASVKIENPLYVAPDVSDSGASDVPDDGDDGGASGAASGFSPGGAPASANPFTPPGEGEVLDNADGETDEKEFFTITTKDEKTYFLIIDRQRGSENVYLLDTVTEKDLLPLAEDAENAGAEVPAATPPAVPSATPEQSPPSANEGEDEPAEKPAEKSGGVGQTAFVVVAVLAVGGIAYYLKIHKPKHSAYSGGDDEDDEPDESPAFSDDGDDDDDEED
jgi:hypothetical protein